MGIKIPDDQIGHGVQPLHVPQATVTEKEKVAAAEVLPDGGIVPNLCAADDHAPSHDLALRESFFVSVCTVMQSRIVMSISGRVLPTMISTRISRR